jgi:acetylornithine/N-succinyldiaminopimelate aminotransferase
VLRFLPSLTVTRAEVDLMIDGLAASLEAVAARPL